MNFKQLPPGVKENILLKNYTTFKIGGRAKYFFVAKDKEDVIRAVLAAKKNKLSFFVLGGGSNTLISDKGFKGLVIKTENRTWKVEGSRIYAEAGVPLSQLVSLALQNNLTGLEWAAGIPGTVGGAIYGNAGAFGKSMGDSVKQVEFFDIKHNKIKVFKKKECRFDYRESIFKKNKNFVILSARFQLKKAKKSEIQKEIKENLNHRKETQPLNFPSAGSVFKNPAPKQSLVRGKPIRFSAGELIEKCGLKGKKIGDAQISEKHANFIVNLGKAKAKDVKKLITLVKKRVKKKFKVNLKEEIQYLG